MPRGLQRVWLNPHALRTFSPPVSSVATTASVAPSAQGLPAPLMTQDALATLLAPVAPQQPVHATPVSVVSGSYPSPGPSMSNETRSTEGSSASHPAPCSTNRADAASPPAPAASAAPAAAPGSDSSSETARQCSCDQCREDRGDAAKARGMWDTCPCARCRELQRHAFRSALDESSSRLRDAARMHIASSATDSANRKTSAPRFASRFDSDWVEEGDDAVRQGRGRGHGNGNGNGHVHGRGSSSSSSSSSSSNASERRMSSDLTLVIVASCVAVAVLCLFLTMRVQARLEASLDTLSRALGRLEAFERRTVGVSLNDAAQMAAAVSASALPPAS